MPNPNHKHTEDLILTLQRTHNLPRRKAVAYTRTILQAVSDIPPNTPLVLRGLGTFERKTIPPHKARNPRTGENLTTSKHDTLRFRPSRNLYT